MNSETMISYARWLLNLLELSSCIIGFNYWNKLKYTDWRWFPYFLAILTAGELVGKWLRTSDELSDYHYYLYQYFLMPLQFLFYYHLLCVYFKPGWQKRLAGASPVIFLACWFVEIFYKAEFEPWFIGLTYNTGCLLLLILLLGYIFQFARTPEILTFKNNMMFWIVLGLFIGYICTFPYYIWRWYLIKLQPQRPELLNIPFYFFIFFNYLMYIFFSIGFIKWKRPN